jgi:hypothetical protein
MRDFPGAVIPELVADERAGVQQNSAGLVARPGREIFPAPAAPGTADDLPLPRADAAHSLANQNRHNGAGEAPDQEDSKRYDD